MTKKLENMNLAELWKFWFKDWEQETPQLEDPNMMRIWSKNVNRAIGESSLLELIQALHLTYEEIDYLEEEAAMREAVYKRICEGLEERVDTIEKSVQLLLKEHEHEAAKITIGQLNRLKGGL